MFRPSGEESIVAQTTTVVQQKRKPVEKQVQPARPTRWNPEQWRNEVHCCGHWWAGATCLYGNHQL